MKIRDRLINDSDLFFWVEEGQGSQGNFDIALSYIKAAADAGADGIEFQLAIAEEFYIESHPGIDSYRKIQYSNEQIKRLIDYCKQLDISFIATVLSESLVQVLLSFNCDAFVINASDINNPGIIDKVIASNIPFFLSLPLATEEEIEWIIKRCVDKGATNFGLMQGQHTMASGEHGVMPEDSNLGFMKVLSEKYKLPVGYIDHSASVTMPAIATAAGANFISKHLILNKAKKGPDWFVCIEPDEMKVCIGLTRKINTSISQKTKVLADGEHLDKTVMRRSIVASESLTKGTVLKKEMLSFKRPGTGISPSIYESLIGKMLIIDVPKDKIFTLKMFGE
jgi:sialic acid synthase SpsE